jgi:hypothetical protein
MSSQKRPIIACATYQKAAAPPALEVVGIRRPDPARRRPGLVALGRAGRAVGYHGNRCHH